MEKIVRETLTGEQSPETTEMSTKSSVFALPIFPWTVVGTFALVTFFIGNIKFLNAGIVMAAIAYIMAFVFAYLGMEEERDIMARANQTSEPMSCYLCENPPQLYYNTDTDTFYVRCNHCNIVGRHEQSADGAVKKWDEMTLEHCNVRKFIKDEGRNEASGGGDDM